MDIKDILTTDTIKVSKHSWTVKRNNKTVGIIRNITGLAVYNDENFGKAVEIRHKIKPYYIKGQGIGINQFYEKDGKIYYLYSIKTQLFYENQLATFGKPLIQDEYNRYINQKNAVDALGQNDVITVVNAIVEY